MALDYEPKKCLMIGAGGFAGIWVRFFIPRFSGRLEVVGLADVDPETLETSADILGLAKDKRFSDMQSAFENTDAGFCVICVPPAFRREAVALAADHGLPILSEKPLADSWGASVEIFRSVKEANVAMAVVQNYRLTRRIRTLKSVLDGGKLGRINYITCRFAADYDLKTVGGAFRYKVANSALYEGSVHHFDQLRNLAGGECAWISGRAWNPGWSDFDNDCCALFTMGMTNGILCQYESSYTAKGSQNEWHHEYFRVECENGAVVVDGDDKVRVTEHLGGGYTKITEVQPIVAGYEGNLDHEGHHRTISAFLDWLDGGPPPETTLDDNIHTAAMSFAAVESSLGNKTVHVPEMLSAAGLA